MTQDNVVIKDNSVWQAMSLAGPCICQLSLHGLFVPRAHWTLSMHHLS